MCTVETLENVAQISGLAFCYFVFRLAELWNRLPLLLSCLFFFTFFFYFSILNYKWNWAKQAIFMLPHLVCVLTLFVCWQHFMRFLSLSYVIVFDNVFSVVLCYQGVLQWLIWVLHVPFALFLSAHHYLLLFSLKRWWRWRVVQCQLSVRVWGLECLNDGEMAQWLRAGLLLPLQLTWVDSEHSHCSSQQPVTPVRESKTFWSPRTSGTCTKHRHTLEQSTHTAKKKKKKNNLFKTFNQYWF